MNIVALCVLAVFSSIISLVLKRYNPEYSIAINIITGILIFAAVLSNVYPAINQVKALVSATKIPADYGFILFKSLGICFLTQFASDSCKDAGESALSSKVELAGKVMILIISLPLFEEIAKIAVTLIGE